MENQFGANWPLDQLKHFHIENVEKSSYIIESGSAFRVFGSIRNNVQDYATTYLIIKFALADNQHATITFDTDRDFGDGQKEALRIVDISPLGKKDFSVEINLPEGLERQTLDMRIELWSPARRTWQKSPFNTIVLFYGSSWGNGIDVIKKEDLVATTFISYAWFSDEHVKWVNNLAQELARRRIKAILDQKDLMPGQLTTLFMQEGVKHSVCVCICSEVYTNKANNSINSGVEFETSMLANQILKGRSRKSIILVVRNNPEKLIPDFLAAAKYIDMDTEHWQGLPLTELATSILAVSK